MVFGVATSLFSPAGEKREQGAHQPPHLSLIKSVVIASFIVAVSITNNPLPREVSPKPHRQRGKRKHQRHQHQIHQPADGAANRARQPAHSALQAIGKARPRANIVLPLTSAIIRCANHFEQTEPTICTASAIPAL